MNAESMGDLAIATLASFEKMKVENIATPLQKYIALRHLLKDKKREIESGRQITWRSMYKLPVAAENKGMMATDTYNIEETMVEATIPWRRTWSYFAYDLITDVSMNRAPSQITKLLSTRRAGGFGSLAELMETNWWGAAPNPTGTTPYSINCYLVYNATEGFNGGDPSGFTSGVAGLPVATYERWKNYTGQYTTVSKPDLIAKMRRAFLLCEFEAPFDLPSEAGANQYGLYTTSDVWLDCVTLAENQNDNLGNDLASKDGKAVFHGVPLTFVPKLDTNPVLTAPVYGINWGALFPVALNGWDVNEGKPEPVPWHHTMRKVDIDLVWNIKCLNRRTQFVLATGTA